MSGWSGQTGTALTSIGIAKRREVGGDGGRCTARAVLAIPCPRPWESKREKASGPSLEPGGGEAVVGVYLGEKLHRCHRRPW